MEFTFHVKGMTCGHCVSRVKQALEAGAGINVTAIDLASGNIKINSDADPGIEQLQSLLDEAGAYTITV
jgi:copper chaperone